MFCPNCGRQLSDGVSFCPTCGTRLAPAQGQGSAQGQVPAQVSRTQVPGPAPTPQASVSAPPQTPPATGRVRTHAVSPENVALVLTALLSLAGGVLMLVRYASGLPLLTQQLALHVAAGAALGAALYALLSLGVGLCLIGLSARCALTLRRHTGPARLLVEPIILIVVCATVFIVSLVVPGEAGSGIGTTAGAALLVVETVAPWARDTLILLAAITILFIWSAARRRSARKGGVRS